LVIVICLIFVICDLEFPISSILYRLRQMTAKRNDLMTAQPYDAKLDES